MSDLAPRLGPRFRARCRQAPAPFARIAPLPCNRAKDPDTSRWDDLILPRAVGRLHDQDPLDRARSSARPS